MIEFFEGWLSGLAGMVPFVHVNLLLQLWEGGKGEGAGLLVFSVSIAFSHLVFQTLPALRWFAPLDFQGVLLPAYRELAERGRAKETVERVSATLLLSLLVAVAGLPLLEILLPLAYETVKPHTAWLLPFLVFLFFVSEKNARDAALGGTVFFLSGVLGWLSFSLPLVKEPLFPLLTGLFAIPALLQATNAQTKPAEKRANASASPELPTKTQWPSLKLVVTGVLAGAFSSLFPALTVTVLASICLLFLEKRAEEFVVLASSIASSKLFYDFIAALSFGKGRNLAAVWVTELARTPAAPALPTLVALAALASCALAVLVLSRISAASTALLEKISMERLRWALLALLLGGNALWNGGTGIVLTATAAAMGTLPVLWKVKHSYAAGALLFPAMLYAAGINT